MWHGWKALLVTFASATASQSRAFPIESTVLRDVEGAFVFRSLHQHIERRGGGEGGGRKKASVDVVNAPTSRSDRCMPRIAATMWRTVDSMENY
jgi:hypothetical protein